MALHGIDISNYQRGLDLSKIKTDFVIVKATEGTTLVMDTCDGFYQQAKSLGIPRGVYHFARPEYNSAEAEAEYFLKHTEAFMERSRVTIQPTRVPALEKTLLVLLVTMPFS